MIDRNEVDPAQFALVVKFLQTAYPNGEESFPTLVKTLGYIAQTMQAVLDDYAAENINHTGVIH